MYNLGYVMDGMGRGLSCGCGPNLGYVMDGMGEDVRDVAWAESELNRMQAQMDRYVVLQTDLQREIDEVLSEVRENRWFYLFHWSQKYDKDALRENLKKTAAVLSVEATATMREWASFCTVNADIIHQIAPERRERYALYLGAASEAMEDMTLAAATRDHALAMEVINAHKEMLDVAQMFPDMQPLVDAVDAARQRFHDIFGESLEEFASKMQGVLTRALLIGGGLIAAVFFAKGLGRGLGSRRSK